MTPADRLNRAAGLLGLEQRIPEETGTVQWVDTWTAIVLALAEQVAKMDEETKNLIPNLLARAEARINEKLAAAKRQTLHLPKDQ